MHGQQFELSDRRQSCGCRGPCIGQFGVRSRSDRRQWRGHPRLVAVHVSPLRVRARPAAIDRTDRTDRKSVARDASAGSTVRRGSPCTRRVAAGHWARVRVERARSAAGPHLGRFALSIASCSLVARVCSEAESTGPGLFDAFRLVLRACLRGLRRACGAARGEPVEPSESRHHGGRRRRAN